MVVPSSLTMVLPQVGHGVITCRYSLDIYLLTLINYIRIIDDLQVSNGLFFTLHKITSLAIPNAYLNPLCHIDYGPAQFQW